LKNARLLKVDPDYLKTLGIELVRGRNFSDQHPTDPEEAVLVNETFVREFELKNPLGYRLTEDENSEVQPKIVGVVKDFHFDPVRKKIEPLVLHMNPNFNRIWVLFARIPPENMSRSVQDIQQVWAGVAPGRTLDYSFLDRDLAAQYKTEGNLTTVFGIAAGLTVIISILGLLGLVTLALSQRVKEIGIRKVLGAGVENILYLFSKKFIALLILANVIAFPLSYYGMHRVLQNFAYHVSIDWWVFVLTGSLVFFVTLVTIGTQVIRAALRNPVDSIRYE